ncbi:MAG TPA: DegT/DnrJ/EryC1/StrS family aminotransferase [Bryobacteraceae bacterium]|nr:DegT/DnrJ/EryC1/StrS family aminotransferase [Bryobacteraceae bacterium]
MIRLLDLSAQYRELETEIHAAIRRVFETSQFVLGQEVAAFEDEFADYCGAQYAVGVNSGTSALHLALLAAGIGEGDEVITTPFTFYATVAAIGYVGATAAYVDIDPVTFNLDTRKIEAAITDRTRAILPVHLYGQPADMDPILDIARRHKLLVIEDAAQAHGAEYRERRVGGIGDLACFSFYPSKNLGAAGEGGMVTTNNPDYARAVASLRNWGEDRRYHPVLKGYNYRMEGLQGAILRVKFRRLEPWTEARRALAAKYDRLLEDSAVTRPHAAGDVRHTYCLYTIRSQDRDGLQRGLEAAGIQTAVHYPLPIHLMPAYADARYKAGDFPCAEACAQSVLSLPLHAHMAAGEVEQVSEQILKLRPKANQETIVSGR